MNETAENWYQTDQASDVVGSITHALLSRKLAEKDPHAWKWTLLAMHAALQGGCVCHLTTTCEPLGALTKRSTNEWFNYLENRPPSGDAKRPKTQLENLPNLLKRTRKPRSAGNNSSHDLIDISNAELELLTNFHEDIRNQFVHFAPMGWSIELSGIPRLAALTARILRGILDAGWGFRNLSNSELGELTNGLVELEHFA